MPAAQKPQKQGVPGAPPHAGAMNLVVVANRLPVRMSEHRGERRWSPSPGGLVSALEPALRERGGVWVGWAESVDDLPIPDSYEGIALRGVPIAAAEFDEF